VKASDELYRVVRGSSGEFEVDRHLPGRGAWLCVGSKGCAEAAVRKGALGRALRAEFDKGAGERLALELERLGYDPPREAGP
jgi:predicted RNA-binding protein YlxR (DUF448 family)